MELYTNTDGTMKTEEINDKIYLQKSEKDLKFDNFVDKVKEIFIKKYNLFLKKLNIETFDLNGLTYLLDVKEISFDKLDGKSQVLRTERFITKVNDENKFKNLKLTKDNPKITGMANLYYSMNEVYKKVQDHNNLNKYLTHFERDPTTDNIFKELRPDCTHSFYDMLSDNISKSDFMKYCSTKLYDK
jgi:hypothetical protein